MGKNGVNNMTKKIAFPCPCGGKIKWKKERVVKEGVDCGILDVEYCEKCSEEYLPDESMEVVENRLREAGLRGVERKEIKFWKSGSSVSIRLPTKMVNALKLNKIHKGFIYPEGNNKLLIEY